MEPLKEIRLDYIKKKKKKHLGNTINHKRGPMDKVRFLKIYEWIKSGKSTEYCAIQLGISRQRVHKILKINGIRYLIDEAHYTRRIKKLVAKKVICKQCKISFFKRHGRIFCSNFCATHWYREHYSEKQRKYLSSPLG